MNTKNIVAFFAVEALILPLLGIYSSLISLKCLSNRVVPIEMSTFSSIFLFGLIAYALLLGVFYWLWAVLYLYAMFCVRKHDKVIKLGVDVIVVMINIIASYTFFEQFSTGEGLALPRQYTFVVVPVFFGLFIVGKIITIPNRDKNPKCENPL